MKDDSKKLVDLKKQIAALKKEIASLKKTKKAKQSSKRTVDNAAKILDSIKMERQRLYDVLETLPVYVALLDQDYRIPFANRFFRERFGDSNGRRCYEYLFNRTEPCDICETYKTLKTDSPQHWEWTGPDNHNYDIYDYPFTESDGAKLILEMGIDVTEQKKAEESLRQSENRYRTLFKEMLSGFALHELILDDNGKPCDYRFLEVNTEFEKLTGLRKDDIIGRRVKEIIPDIEPFWIERYGQVVLTGEPMQFEGHSGALGRHYEAKAFQTEPGKFAVVFADITERKEAEEALAESQKHYHDLFHNLETPAYLLKLVTDDDGNAVDLLYLEVNHAFEEFMKLESSKIVGKNITDLIPGYSKHPNFKKLIDVALTGKSHREEITSVIEGRIVDVTFYRPAAKQVAVIFSDVTDRRKAEEALRQSEERFHSLYDSMITSLSLNEIVLDEKGNPIDAIFLDVNPAFEKITGLKRSEVIGKREFGIFPFLDKQWLETCARVSQTGQSARLQQHFEDGDKYFEVIIFSPGKGQFAVIREDITEKMRAEYALRESEEKFRTAFDNAVIGRSLTTPDGQMIMINHAMAEMIGYTKEELMSANFASITHPDDVAKSMECIQCLLAGEQKTYQFEKRYIHKDGHFVFVSVNSMLLNDSKGDPLYLISDIIDITERKQAEEALNVSRKRLELALKGGELGYWDWNLLTDEFVVNDRFLGIIGYLPGEIQMSHIQDAFTLVHPEDVNLINKAVEDHRSGKSVNYDVEFRLRAKDGQYRWINSRGMILERDEDRQQLRFVGTHADITERKLAEEKLRQAGVYNRSLLESSLDPLVTIAPDGKITDVNAATEIITGLRRDELVGTDFSDYFTEPGKAQEGYQRVFREGLVKDYPLEVKHRDGHITSVIYNASLYKDETGNVIGIFAAARDITERKAAEERVRRLNRLYSVLSGINEAIVRIRDVDELYDEACSIAIEQGKLRMAWIGLVDDATGFVKAVAAAGTIDGYLDNIKISPFDEKFGQGPTGSCIRENKYNLCGEIESNPRMAPWREEALKRGYRSSAAFPLHMESKVIGALTFYSDDPFFFTDEEIQLLDSLANDISFAIESIEQEKLRQKAEAEVRQINEELEQRVKDRTAELEASNKELESFSYSVSHDLRAPLRAIDGFSRIILEDYQSKLDSEGTRVLNVIRKNTHAMAKLIDDLLSFSRTGRQKILRTKINMENMAQTLFEEIKVTIPEREIRFDIDNPPPVWADSSLIRQVIINLLTNAVKFTKTEEQAIIEFGGKTENHENIYYVKDNGVGFDMQYADKLFGVFQRLHGSEEFEGTGVGLAIVQRIIHMHGGRIWAEAKINEGAIFYFSLPI